ncbi:MAG TPA: hypothetical protein PKM36_11715 [Propionibacteriaceae bacterium]|nr:hypothetical protein [Propionibacteriaceae bacterium]
MVTLYENPLSSAADIADFIEQVDGPQVLQPVRSAVNISTNDAAQYGLAAIQLLALLGDPPA